MSEPTNTVAPVTLITAAGRGMGAAIARELAGRGHRLGLLSPSGAVEDLATELNGSSDETDETDESGETDETEEPAEATVPDLDFDQAQLLYLDALDRLSASLDELQALLPGEILPEVEPSTDESDRFAEDGDSGRARTTRRRTCPRAARPSGPTRSARPGSARTPGPTDAAPCSVSASTWSASSRAPR